MQRDTIIKKIIKGFGFMLFGNILSGIMVISIAPVISVWFITLVAQLLTIIIYGALMFTVGFRDGQRECQLLKNHRVESVPKNTWLILGTILWVVMCVPVIVLMLGINGAITITGEYMFVYRFLCGAVMPLLYIGELTQAAVAEYPLWLPLVSMGIYLLLTPVAAHIGYRFGLDEEKQRSFMYEKK